MMNPNYTEEGLRLIIDCLKLLKEQMEITQKIPQALLSLMPLQLQLTLKLHTLAEEIGGETYEISEGG